MQKRSTWVLVGTGLFACAGALSAQWTTDRWVSLAEMPVAVTRLEVAGVPLADLRLFVPALNVTQVQPALFLETVRTVPVLQQYYVMDDDYIDMSGAHPTNHGGYVQHLLSRGLRGTALADAIHGDLRTRGLDGNPTSYGRIDVMHPNYIVVWEGFPGGGRGRAEGQRGAASPGRGSSNANDRARSLGDDLKGRKGGGNESRPSLEPRGRGSSAAPGNAPGRGNGGGAPAPGRGRGNGGGGSEGGRGRGGGGGRGHGRGK